jgi:SAM-dependent methyltransferase
MRLIKRIDPAKWWMRQKFTADNRAVRNDNLYGAVQWCFLENYFKRVIAHGSRVVDLGCGIGIYSNLMARYGAQVIGIDPSEEYLEVARTNAVDNVSFLKASIGEGDGLAAVPDASADIVFMSDALLFYFVPFYPGQKADIQVLLGDIRRILKPGGMFVSLEPHAMFYMSAWLGAEDRPFTILTEYLHKSFGIVPPFSWLVHAFAESGFVVKDLFEIGPSEYFKAVDVRGYHFAREFPLWQLLELRVMSS